MQAMTTQFSSESSKIQSHHRERLAVVYVRQSTIQQVEKHQESTRLQYGLAERAIALGWSRHQVLVIDDDLGKSGTSTEGRPGFQRLVAEVSLAHVGIVLGLDMSRLARSCRDWYQLLDVCALFNTLIGDLDGVYDPSDYNGRLILGLKGTMSEAELHVLKQRMLAGKRAKAERGELGKRVPMGYVRSPSGDTIKDPDEQVRTTVALIFELFERIGTLNGLLKYLIEHQIQVPHRAHCTPNKGELEWHRPNRWHLSDVLHNPIYAGAYAYGRHHLDLKDKQPGRGTEVKVGNSHQWSVLLKERLPAYISWAQFEQNLEQLANNRSHAFGVPRYGPSLLSGLLICGQCGYRMATHYGHSGRYLRYSCERASVNYGAEPCQSVAGGQLDEWVSSLVLRALEPGALELSLKIAEDLESERQQLHQLWQQRLQRAKFEAERAARQYNAVEPENRLVARTLEKKWEEALAGQASLQAEYARFEAEQPACLSAEERKAIRRLASDIPILWEAPTTTNADRQAIVRLLVERVIVTLQGESEKVDIQVHWVGGHGTQTTLIRPVARWQQLSYYPQLVSRLRELYDQGHSGSAIAKILNAEGWKPTKKGKTFNAQSVNLLLQRQGLRSIACSRKVNRETNELTLKELAQTLDMPFQTLVVWLRKGKIEGRCDRSSSQPLWLIKADAAEIKRLRALRAASRS